MAKMTDDDFETAIDAAITSAAQWQEQTYNTDRQTAYDYYMGIMPGAPAGRSQARSMDVFETIESAMPDLIEIFLGGDNVAEYEPVGEEDDEFAVQATDYINYILLKQNPGFLIFVTLLKDALLSKVGVVRASWAEKQTIKDRDYTGITEMQLTQLVDDDDVEVLSQDSYNDPVEVAQRAEAKKAMEDMTPEMAFAVAEQLAAPVGKLYDVKIRRTSKKGRVYIDNIQPENFIISPRAKNLHSADIVGEMKSVTRSDLVELGYSKSKAKEAQSFDTVIMNERGISESSIYDTGYQVDYESTDDSTQEITIFDGFVRVDYDGDGIAEWRRVVRAGNITLENEAGEPDFAIVSPIIIPHAAIGISLADVVVPLQESSTALQRQYLDGLMLANNPRTFAIENQVNMNDLLNNRVGGVVRVKSAQAVGPLITSQVDTGAALQGLEFMDSRRELRTGITRYNQGLDADSLNKTATGVTKIMSAGDARKRMMARIMAETGVKDLFRLLLRLVIDNQDKAATVRLNGQWVEVNPQPWNPDMDVTIETGLGTGDKSQMVASLSLVINAQKEAMQNGLSIADEQNVYNSLASILKASGIKSIDKYFKDPSKQPPKQPKPPEPTPEQALAEATVKAEGIKAQVKMKELEVNSQIKEKELEMKRIDLQIKQAELQLKHLEAEHDAKIADHEQNRKDAQFLRDSIDSGNSAKMSEQEQNRKDAEFLRNSMTGDNNG